ncbi:MAG: Gfo/Idh/MocA family oxidoreductase, partial [Candidatus Flemingiibacterium sp.]
HAIDWMAWLSGEKYTDVSAMLSRRENGGNGDMDIAAAAQFTMTNDVIATVTADMYRPSSAKTHGDDRVRVVGTKGIIEVMSGKATLISDDEGGLIELPDEPAGDIFEDFLDNLAGKSNHLTKESTVSSTYWALRADRQALSRLG